MRIRDFLKEARNMYMRQRSIAGRLRKDMFKCAVSAMFSHKPEAHHGKAQIRVQTLIAREMIAAAETGVPSPQRPKPKVSSSSARVKSAFHGNISLKEYRHALHPPSKLLLGPKYARIPMDQKHTLKQDEKLSNWKVQEEYRLRASKNPTLMVPDRFLPVHSMGPLSRRKNIYQNPPKLKTAVSIIQRCWRSYKSRKDFIIKIHFLKKRKEEADALKAQMAADLAASQKPTQPSQANLTLMNNNYTPQGSMSMLPPGSAVKLQSTSKLTQQGGLGHRPNKPSITIIEETESSALSKLQPPAPILDLPEEVDPILGSDLPLASSDLQKMIMTCCKKNNLSQLEACLTPISPSDVNVRDPLFNTPIWYAAKHGHKNLNSYLVEQGAEVNVLCSGGDTPLHNAFLSGNRAAVEFLVECCASPNQINQQGETPICFGNKYLIKEMALELAVCKVTDDRAEFDNRIYFECFNPDHVRKHYPEELSSIMFSSRSKQYVK